MTELFLAYDEETMALIGVFPTRELALAKLEEYVEEVREVIPEFEDNLCFVDEVNYCG